MLSPNGSAKFTITNSVIVQPGESVILLESRTAEPFVQWWGVSNLPPRLQFVTYGANGLTDTGDYIHLWDPNETDPANFVAVAEFTVANPGVTRWFDSGRCESCDLCEFGVESTDGVCGTFQAAQGCGNEVGSPGWTRWTRPTLTSVRWTGGKVELAWSAQAGSTNRVQYARRLAVPFDATVWEDLGDYRFPRPASVAVDTTLGTEPQRFYRVMRVAAADCPCPEN
jgi:hypothetical protein